MSEQGNGFNVVDFDGLTSHEIDPDKVLFNNVGEFSSVIIVGTDRETGALVVASSFPDRYKLVYQLEAAKLMAMEAD